MTAEGVEVRATNGAAFFGALSGIATGLGDLREPLDGAGALIAAAARAASPRRSGAMAGAHTATRHGGRNRLRVTVATPYAAPVHWGWPDHGIRRQPWVVASFNRDTGWMDRLGDGVQTAVLDKAAAKT